jgi:hypothetical protein
MAEEFILALISIPSQCLICYFKIQGWITRIRIMMSIAQELSSSNGINAQCRYCGPWSRSIATADHKPTGGGQRTANTCICPRRARTEIPPMKNKGSRDGRNGLYRVEAIRTKPGPSAIMIVTGGKREQRERS